VWNYVISHFDSFLKELELSTDDRKDADGKAERIARSLFAKYYPNKLVFDSSCYVKVGSYGKDCGSSNHSDLDMLFILPWDVYTRVNAVSGNGQSQLLQELKAPLLVTFPTTSLKADGQIVKAPFKSYHVEVVPAFRMLDGTFLTAYTSGMGSWKIANPVEEYKQLHATDLATQGKARRLTKMLKAWKYDCNVELKSISLEVLAVIFVNQWQFRSQTVFYYDWMVRDFFQFLLLYVDGRTRVPGTEEWIELGDCWGTKAQSAYARAVKACEFEKQDKPYSATLEWQKIFGTTFQGTSMLLGALLQA
jgi:Second Messenger Oligonucleotide or Dinucleotide Synthetase domain